MFLPWSPSCQGPDCLSRSQREVCTANFQKPGFPILTEIACFFREVLGGRKEEIRRGAFGSRRRVLALLPGLLSWGVRIS